VDDTFDRARSLQDLEGDDWGEPTHKSPLVETCHRLRRKRLVDFSVEDLRIMIGQRIGLRFLVPLALDQLEQQPLAEGDFYPGDLLAAVLRSDQSFWARHPKFLGRIRGIVRGVRSSAVHLEPPVRDSLDGASSWLTME
jgi:hypothetical protein